MTASFDYALPKVWTWKSRTAGGFANINRPIAGPTHDKDLPVGHHPSNSIPGNAERCGR